MSDPYANPEHDKWVEAGQCPAISVNKAWCMLAAGHEGDWHKSPFQHSDNHTTIVSWIGEYPKPREPEVKVSLVELLTEHEFFDDPAVCGCGENGPGVFDSQDSWQCWIAHVQQVLGERILELTCPGFTLVPHGEWSVKPYDPDAEPLEDEPIGEGAMDAGWLAEHGHDTWTHGDTTGGTG